MMDRCFNLLRSIHIICFILFKRVLQMDWTWRDILVAARKSFALSVRQDYGVRVSNCTRGFVYYFSNMEVFPFACE